MFKGKIIKLISFFVISSILIFNMSNSNAQNIKNNQNLLFIDLKYGQVVVELMPQIAPKHVERIKTLANKGFYDNIKFHRVIAGFMAQTGDPTGTGMGSSDLPDLRQNFLLNLILEALSQWLVPKIQIAPIVNFLS